MDTTMGSGLTRREALRRGAALGAGFVWVAPAVRHLPLTAALAQAASPVETTTTQPQTTTTQPQTTTTQPQTTTTNPPSTVAGAQIGTGEDTEVAGIQITGPLPYTGFDLGPVVSVATGLIAGGSIAVAATRKKGDESGQDPDRETD